MSDTILSCEKLNIFYDKEHVVKDVSFSLKRGEILGIAGESGSGKSTIIKASMGLLGKDAKIESGDIVFEDTNLCTTSEKEMRKLRGNKLGIVFQNPETYLCPVRKVGKQIAESINAHENTDAKKAKEHALEIFERLNLKDGERIYESYPFELSGGMNQRVAIATACLMNPRVLLVDEPTSALDRLAKKQVEDELLLLREKNNTAVIVVTHDIKLLEDVADNILVLKDGTVQEYGTKEDVLSSPKSSYTRLLIDSVPKGKGKRWNLLSE
ncbi:MAG: ABC transporter ATP-binding protein [Lachnospiraceae bacterium]|nr:ABC transporter ATP-binding protein [Lachnospiraceae bacterium]